MPGYAQYIFETIFLAKEVNFKSPPHRSVNLKRTHKSPLTNGACMYAAARELFWTFSVLKGGGGWGGGRFLKIEPIKIHTYN